MAAGTVVLSGGTMVLSGGTVVLSGGTVVFAGKHQAPLTACLARPLNDFGQADEKIPHRWVITAHDTVSFLRGPRTPVGDRWRGL
jgi:hypothetical protein